MTNNNSKTNTKKIFNFKNIEKFLLFFLILTIIVFILWPILAVFYKSLIINGSFNFTCYHALFVKNYKLLLNSLFISCTSTFFAVLLGLIIALYITYLKLPGKLFIFLVLLLTMISPPFVTSLAYIMLFGRRGLITYKLLGLHLNPYGWHGIILMQTISQASIAALIILGILRSIDKKFEQSSMDLGANGLRTLFKVTLPLAKSGIIAAALIVFVRSLADFGTPIIIGGGYKVLATEAYLNVIGLYNLPNASAMSVLLLIPALIAFILYRKMINNSNFYSAKKNSFDNFSINLPHWFTGGIAIITYLFIIFILLKYATIFWGAFAKTWGIDYSFSLKHISKLNINKLGSFFRSIKYSIIAGIAGSIIALILSYIIERKKIYGNNIIDFIVTLPFMIPGIFFGIGYVLAFHSKPLLLTGTGFIVIVNCIYRQLPLGTKAGSSVLSQLNPEMESSARDLGANEFFLFKDIILPNMKSAFLLSFINTFTATMTTIGAVIFLITPSSKIATVEMFDAIKNGNIGTGAVLANLIIFTVLIINLLFTWFLLREKKTKTNYKKSKISYVSTIEPNY